MKNQKAPMQRWHTLARQFLGEDFFEEVMTGIKKKEPAVDVYHGSHEVVVVVDLPGIVDVNSIQLRVEGDTLHIQGAIPAPYQGFRTYVSERTKGAFEKSIQLGAIVSKANASARYRRGVLEIRFPKVEKASSTPRFST